MALLGLILFVWVVYLQIKLNNIERSLTTLDFSKFQIEKQKMNKTDGQNVKEVNNIETSSKEEIQIDSKSENFEKISKNYLRKEKFDFEKTFLGNVFNKIGAVALIIGMIIFVKLITPYFAFTPIMKTVLGFIVGLGLILGAEKLSASEKLKNYSEVLTGTGVGILFITVFCAYSLFHVLNMFFTVVIATLLLIGAYIIADKKKTVSMIAIALIGGYLTPIILAIQNSTEFYCIYCIFLNVVSLIFAYRNPDKAFINFFNLVASFFMFIWYFSVNSTNVVYPLGLWGIYLLYDIVRKHKCIDPADKTNILSYMNLAVLSLLSIIILGEDEKLQLGSLLISVGVVYAGLISSFIKKNNDDYKPYLYSMLVVLMLATYFMTSSAYRVGLWSLEALALAFAAYKYNIKSLANWALVFLSVSVTAIFFVQNVVYTADISLYKPILNIRLLTFAFPIATAIGANYLLKKREETLKYSNIFKFCWISLVYMLVSFEFNDFLNKYLLIKNVSLGFIKSMIYPIIGFKYALQTRRIYNLSNMELFNIASYFIGLIALLVILLCGLEYRPLDGFIPVLNIRFVAYMAAIVSAIIYSKWVKTDWFKYLAVLLGFILVHIETNDLINAYLVTDLSYLVSIMWIVYAGIVTTFGIFKNKKFLKNTGIWISILAILRIFIFDLAGVEAAYKLAAFLVLGTILMIVSYFYNKYKS